jgi:type IV pilus assembly protein PilA
MPPVGMFRDRNPEPFLEGMCHLAHPDPEVGGNYISRSRKPTTEGEKDMLLWFGKQLQEMQEVKRDERGFTLIELMVVVVIIAILAAIALPIFLQQRAKAADSRATANVREAATAVVLYYQENGTAPANIAALNGYGFQQSDPAVVMFAEGSAANANWCISTPTNGGTADHFKMLETDGKPLPAAAACAAAAG